MRPFHLAFPVTDLKSTKSFYVDILKCEIGRSSDAWIDFNMFGHQVVAHLVDENDHPASNSCLLYTSPSPRDRTRSRMPSSA